MQIFLRLPAARPCHSARGSLLYMDSHYCLSSNRRQFAALFLLRFWRGTRHAAGLYIWIFIVACLLKLKCIELFLQLPVFCSLRNSMSFHTDSFQRYLITKVVPFSNSDFYYASVFFLSFWIVAIPCQNICEYFFNYQFLHIKQFNINFSMHENRQFFHTSDVITILMYIKMTALT